MFHLCYVGLLSDLPGCPGCESCSSHGIRPSCLFRSVGPPNDRESADRQSVRWSHRPTPLQAEVLRSHRQFGPSGISATQSTSCYAYLPDVEQEYGPCTIHAGLVHFRQPMVELRVVVFDYPTSAEEPHDSRILIEAAAHDRCSAVLVEVTDGLCS